MSTESTLALVAIVIKLADALGHTASTIKSLMLGKPITDDDLTAHQKEVDCVVEEWRNMLAQIRVKGA